MGSYTFYLAIMAISFITLQICIREVRCKNSLEFEQDDYVESNSDYSQSTEEVEENEDEYEKTNSVYSKSTEQEEYNYCKEYKSKIWDEAFNEPAAMDLMEGIFAFTKRAYTDEVCSDTVRSVFNFVGTMTTNENSNYVFKMFHDMVSDISMEIDKTSDEYIDTMNVVERITYDPVIRDLSVSMVNRLAELLKNPQTHDRFIIALKGMASLFRPSANEVLVKKKIQQLKNVVNTQGKMVKGAINRVGNFFLRR